MNDEMIAQEGNTAKIPRLQAFAGAEVGKGYPADPGGHCTMYRIGISGCRPVCLP